MINQYNNDVVIAITLSVFSDVSNTYLKKQFPENIASCDCKNELVCQYIVDGRLLR